MSNSTITKISIPIALISVILFRLFIDFIGLIIGSLNIERLIFDYGLKYLIFSIIELLGVLVFFYNIDKKAFRLERTSLIYYLLAVILAIAYVLSQELLNTFYDWVFKTDYSNLSLNFKLPSLNKLFISQVLLVPISEEFFFRNFIQKGLHKNYKPTIAILVTSSLFALIHIPDIHNIYLVAFGGLIASILYYKSKSIIPPLIFHILWNFLVSSSL